MKWICKVCGYIHEGDQPPEICPVCKVGREFFEKLEEGPRFVSEPLLGVARGVDNKAQEGFKTRLTADSHSAAQYLAMARAADREGFPEVANALARIAQDKLLHAARAMELLGESVSAATRDNLASRLEAEAQASQDSQALTEVCRGLGLDAAHELAHEISRDQTRHGQMVEGLLTRLFAKKD